MTVPEKTSWLDKFMEKTIHMLNRDDTRKKMHMYLIDPLLNHVMERVFPYIVLTCLLFTVLLIFVMLTFGMLVLQSRTNTTHLFDITNAVAKAVPNLATI